jgi:Protein of unknown function, DUF481
MISSRFLREPGICSVFCLVFCCAFLFSGFAARADQVVMKNGSVLVGELVSADESRVIFSTPFAGNITINQQNITSIITDSKVDLLLANGELIRDRQIMAENEELVVLGGDDVVRFDVPDIAMLNPEPWQLGLGYKWSGMLDGSIGSARGNADTDELDLNMESIWRGYKNRYTVRGNWEIDQANGDRNKYKWLVRAKYDRFQDKEMKNYLGMQVALDHDEFQDLDLRQSVGPYYGRQFYEQQFLNVHGELGVVYVEEEFEMAQDNDYWGVNWEVRAATESILGFQFYASQEGISDVTESAELLMNTVLGVRFPTLFGFASAAEAVYQYDGGAVEGVDDTDETYRFKVGYVW